MTPAERFKGIEAFVTTVDTGSFTAAGRKLNLTNSAISKGVAKLEERLGIRLFERTTRSLKLTDVGTTFYRTCVSVLSELEEAEAILKKETHEPVGKLQINLPSTYGRLRVMPALLNILQNYPHLEPYISLTDRFVDVLDEGIDIAVRIGGPDHWPKSLMHQYLGKEQLVFCASPEYLQKHGTPQKSGQLAAHHAVLYGKADGSTSAWLIPNTAGQIERRIMNMRMVIDNAETLVSAVKAGYGIAQLATWLIEDYLEKGALVVILPELKTDGLPLNIVWAINKQFLPKVYMIVEMLAKELHIQ